MGSKKNPPDYRPLPPRRSPDIVREIPTPGVPEPPQGPNPELVVSLERINLAVVKKLTLLEPVYIDLESQPIRVQRLEGETIGYVPDNLYRKVLSRGTSGGVVVGATAEGNGSCRVRIQ